MTSKLHFLIDTDAGELEQVRQSLQAEHYTIYRVPTTCKDIADIQFWVEGHLQVWNNATQFTQEQVILADRWEVIQVLHYHVERDWLRMPELELLHPFILNHHLYTHWPIEMFKYTNGYWMLQGDYYAEMD